MLLDALNIVGTGAISTSGTGNTVTIAFGSSGASPGDVLVINNSGIAEFEPLLFNENSGSATFNASGALSIVGTGAISTSGTGSQVTITFGSSGASPGDVLVINSSGIAEFEPLLFNENSGSATFDASGSLNIIGTGAISTSGTGNTVTIAFGSSGASPGDVLVINNSGIAEFEPLLFNENSGSATFNASGALSIVGTGAISTSGTGTQVTIAFGSSGASPGDVLVINNSGIAEFEPLLFNENSGSATFDASGSLNIIGTGAISTSGTGNTVTIALALQDHLLATSS